MKRNATIVWMIVLLLASAALLEACSAPGGGETPPHAAGSGEASAPEQGGEYRTLTPEEAKARMDENPGAVVVDVRTQAEFDEGHIEGAILIPNETIGEEPPRDLPDLDAEVLVYCRSGNRSRQAAEKLLALGYTNVWDFGGIGDWPYTVVKQESGCLGLTPSQVALAKSFSPGWNAIDLEGNTVDETILEDSRLNLVTIWGTYCSGCVAELEALQAVYDHYDRADLNIIGVVASALEPDGSLREGEITIIRQLQDITGAAFPQLIPAKGFEAMGLSDPAGLPEAVLLDSRGNRVGDPILGARDAEQWRAVIDGALLELNQ